MSGGGDIRRERMVAELRSRGIVHPAVLAAMGAIPRERFVPEALASRAYAVDAALPIGEHQTISQPWVVARIGELAEPDDGGRVLEIGTGSGYQTAVLSKLFAQVYSVERIPVLGQRALRTVRGLGLQNVHFKIFDGSYGWSEFAPYAAIVVAAAAAEPPAPLVEQLDEGGRLVLPLAEPSAPEEQTLVRVLKRNGRPIVEKHGPCRFVPLVGKFGWHT